MRTRIKNIVIVGGGAGGLELATQLGDTLGKSQTASITLIDPGLTHVWKPLWHEVAAGTLTENESEVSYIIHSYHHHYNFQLGSMIALDRKNKKIIVSSIKDKITNEEILPERIINYDMLVIAIGSVGNDFDVPGVREYCFFLDSYLDCQKFHQQFLHELMRLQEAQQPQLEIAIVGGGATGVELAAELQFACYKALTYKHKSILTIPKIQITIIESATRLLSTLPETISNKIANELEKRGIKVLSNERVIKVESEYVITNSGKYIRADLKVWAAGIKAPEILKEFDLALNQRTQIEVKQTLQTISDENIFAFGDCANCPQPNKHEPVPPRAQAAHQQALLLVKSLTGYVQNKPLIPYVYHDYGSLITLSRSRTLGTLMGRAVGNILLEGKLARIAYQFLYYRHQAALYGWWYVIRMIIAQLLTQPIRPHLKLH